VSNWLNKIAVNRLLLILLLLCHNVTRLLVGWRDQSYQEPLPEHYDHQPGEHLPQHGVRRRGRGDGRGRGQLCPGQRLPPGRDEGGGATQTTAVTPTGLDTATRSQQGG
jgi:hypothetical protein